MATRNGRLIGLEPDSGDQRWIVPILAVRGSGPAVGAGAAFVAEIARNGSLHAVELGDGSRRWSTPIGPTTASPVISRDAVIICSEQLGGVAAFEVSDGSRRWRSELPTWRGSPAANDELILVATAEGVSALSPSDGGTVWTAELGPAASTPALWDGVVAVALEVGEVALLSAADGAVQLQLEVGGTRVGAPALDGEQLYIVGDELVVFDLEDGSERWRAPAAPGTSPTVAGEVVLLPLSSDRIVAYHRDDGRRLWEHELSREMGALPVVAHGSVWVALRVDLEGQAYLVALAAEEQDEGDSEEE